MKVATFWKKGGKFEQEEPFALEICTASVFNLISL
jgi:hypothetical protein